jgi:SPP1 gp7 family putative phage head morphogenesis protein
MKNHVTSDERKQAVLVDAARSRVERTGIIAAQRIGFATQQAAAKILRRGGGIGDMVQAVKSSMAKAVPLLADCMIAGHLTGISRTKHAAKFSLELRSLKSMGATPKTAYQKALDVLRARLKLPGDKLDLLRSQYDAEAVRVVNKTTAAIEARLQSTFLKATAEGMHVKEGKKLLAEAFEKAGIVPRNSFTVEAVFRTQTQLAYGAGQWRADQDPDIQEILWGYKYITVGDDRVRPEHVGFDGVTLPKEDSFWQTNWPPNGWCCRCSAISLFEERKITPPPASVMVDGREVAPSADKGFQFNPGLLFGGSV